MRGAVTLYKELKNNANVISLLSTCDTGACIARGLVDPKTWTVDMTTALIYRLGDVNLSTPAMSVEYVVNCRAKTADDSEELAVAVCDALYRVRIDGWGQFYPVQGATLQPADNTDNFNTPVTVTVKTGFNKE